MEVGLGGIQDATNVMEQSLLSIITSISFDHMEVLGNNLAAIAEKKSRDYKRRWHGSFQSTGF